MKRSPSLLALPLLLFLGASCAPDTEDLEVGASIESASLSVKKSAFGSGTDPQGTPEGTFTLVLSLGELASSGTDATVQQFALVDAATQQALLAPVLVQASAPRSFRVEIGETERFTYTLAYDKPVSIGPLCAAQQVQFTGTVLDSARGKTTPVTSKPITVSCP